MFMKRVMVCLSLLLCVAILFPVCGYGADAKKIVLPKKDRDTLIFGAENEPSGLDMINQTTQGSITISTPLFERLIKCNDVTGTFEPLLATEWHWVNDTTLALTLRDDVYFHNGEKLTAEDVKYTIERLKDGTATSSLYSSFDGPNSKVIDATHIEIAFKQPCAPALALLSSPGSNVVCKSYVEKVGNDVFARNPIGTGPFKFVRWDSGDSIYYERNDKYWGKTSEYKNLTMRIIADVGARMIAVEAGDVDITVTLLQSLTRRIKNGEAPGLDYYAIPSVYFFWLAMSDEFEPFRNLKVRQAIAHAIDTEQVVFASYGPNGARLSSIVPEATWGYKKAEPYEYNPELSKKLLAEAGYPNGFDVDFVTSEATNAADAGEAVSAMLSQVGIRAQQKKFTASNWQTMVLNGTAPMSFGGMAVSTGDISQGVAHLRSTAPQVTYKWHDPHVDTLLDRGIQEMNPEKRYEIYAELQDYVLENCLDIPLLDVYFSFACRDYIQGFVPHSRQFLDFPSITFAK
ncbi:diguanylate phosphodiesterase [Synergistales bacterium]|nr:diguanylate phosphodiesterase [Synergistales bacterium]